MPLPLLLPLLLLALCTAPASVAAADIACRDARNFFSCGLLKNSDGEACCWCGSGPTTNGTCLAKSQPCTTGPFTCGASPAQPSDPCANLSVVASCSQCGALQAGCGWCSAGPGVPGGASCGSGTAAGPFAFAGATCADPADNWWVDGACPADNQFFGVPLPPWFALFTACIILVFGTGMTFVGYRLFKVAIIGVGLGASGVPAFLYTWSFAPDAGTFSLSTAVLAACVAAGVGGFLCWRLFKVGVFIMGASLGVIVAMLLHILVFARFLSAYGNTPLIVAAVLLGLGLGALGLRFMRKTMVVATSTLGAYAAIRGVSLFVPGSFLSELTLARRIQAGETLPQAMDGYLGGIAALALAGMLVQFLVTARKVGKDDAKDELEKELEESELSLEALQGKKKKRGSKRRKGGRASKAASQKNDALLQDYGVGGGDEYYEGGYDESEAWLEEEAPPQEEFEMVETQPEKKKGWGWGSSKKAPAGQAAASINSSSSSSSSSRGTPTRPKQAQVSW